MNLRKISATLLISAISAILLSTTLGVSLAQADDKESHPTPTAGAPLSPRPHREDRDDHDGKSEHDQLREQYGDKDIDQVFLPPLVVTDPASAFNPRGAGQKPPIAPGADAGNNLVDASNIDPNANAPINLDQIKATRQTPAETFFELATVALVTMAAGSAALGAIAIRRAVKLRKTPNSDFIYE